MAKESGLAILLGKMGGRKSDDSKDTAGDKDSAREELKAALDAMREGDLEAALDFHKLAGDYLANHDDD